MRHCLVDSKIAIAGELRLPLHRGSEYWGSQVMPAEGRGLGSRTTQRRRQELWGLARAYQLRFRFGDAGRRRMRKARSRAVSDRVCSWFRSRRQRPGRRALAGSLPQGCGRDVRRPQVQLRVAEIMLSNESPVRKVRTLGSMHGERKRGQGGDRGTGTMAKAARISLPLRPRRVRLSSAQLASWER